MRRFAFILLAASLAAAACGGGTATSNPGGGGGTKAPVASTGGGGGAADWGTTGSAQVTVGGTTVTLSPGGCTGSLAEGVAFRFGGWTTPTTANWVVGNALRDGSKPTAISGGLNGKMYVLGEDRTATVGSDGKGTFSGTDTLSNLGKITGTFSCT